MMRFECKPFDGWLIDDGCETRFAEWGELETTLGDHGIQEAEITSEAGFLWRLSASGYLDCTEWSLAATEADAADACLEMWYDGDWAEMTDDELADAEELLILAGRSTGSEADDIANERLRREEARR